MPGKISLTKKLIAVALTILVTPSAGIVLLSRINPSATVRTFFWLERTWDERWPLRYGRNAIQGLEPTLLRMGILAPARVEVEPGVSFLLDPRDFVPVTILRNRAWQPEVWESISGVLSDGSVFLDVGAHIGYFSMKAARKVGKMGRVVAFEPNPETVKLLRDNVIANQAHNVIVEPIACADREQMLTFYASPIQNTGASSLARINADISVKEAPRAYTVRARSIDDVIRELNLARVDAIKIDVEGAEVAVLQGAVNTLQRFHPRVVVETVPEHLANFHTTADELASVLKKAGYNRSKPLNPQETDWQWLVQEARDMASTIRIEDPSTAGQLIKGFYALEQKAWRWTESKFTVALRTPSGAKHKGAMLTLRFTIPEVSLNKLKTMTVSAKVGNLNLAPETFTIQGHHEYRREIASIALSKDSVDVDFTLDKFLGPPESQVELGVIVTSIALESR